MSQKIKTPDKDGNLKEVNNPMFVNALQDFVIFSVHYPFY